MGVHHHPGWVSWTNMDDYLEDKKKYEKIN
jgi:hypothetical protein